MGRGAPMLSVVIPSIGRTAWLEEAVTSVVDDGGSDVEVIVVDDASADGVTLPADPRVRVVRRTARGGPAAARNTGIAVASGALIAFCDDDDRWASGRTEVGVEGTDRAPIGLCRSADLATGRPAAPVLDGWIGDRILDATTPHLGSCTVRRGDMLAFDERYAACEDVAWWLRIAQSVPAAAIDQVGYLIRNHAGVRLTHGDAARLEWSLRLLDEHAEYFAAHPRAAAFRWKRVGVLAERLGDLMLARRALARSLRAKPHPGTAGRLVRALARRSP